MQHRDTRHDTIEHPHAKTLVSTLEHQVSSCDTNDNDKDDDVNMNQPLELVIKYSITVVAETTISNKNTKCFYA